MQELLIEPQNGWVTLRLNRPLARNALNTQLLARLAQTFDRLAQEDSCRAVLLTGAAGHFAAGADITEIEGKSTAEGAADPRKGYWARIAEFPKPVLAAVDGYCLGGGFELALMCDGIVAGTSGKFGLPESTLGLIPGAGGLQRLEALIGRARALRMVFFGEVVDAATAEAWGIAAWRAAGSAEEQAAHLVEVLSRRAPLALAAIKRSIRAGASRRLALDEERQFFETLLDSDDKKEGIAAFREKRRPEFKGK